MRIPLFSLGILLALALVVTGCGGGEKTDKPATESNSSSSGDATQGNTAVRTSGQTSHPSQEVVVKFLTEILKDNTNGAFALFTPKAQQEYAKTNSKLDPQHFKGMEFRVTGGDALPESDGNIFGIYVDMIDSGESIETVWGVRKIGNEYRIANLMMNYEGQVVTLDFEDPTGTRNAWPGDSSEQQAMANQQPQPQVGPSATNQAMQQQNAMNTLQQQQAPMQQPSQFNAQGFQAPIQNPPQMAQPNAPYIQ